MYKKTKMGLLTNPDVTKSVRRDFFYISLYVKTYISPYVKIYINVNPALMKLFVFKQVSIYVTCVVHIHTS